MSTDDTTLDPTEHIDPVAAATKTLRRLASLSRRRKQLKQSFETLDRELAANQAEMRAAAKALLGRFGPIQTVAGRIGRPTGYTQHVDDEQLLVWARENRPGVVKESVSTAALIESGCTWVGLQMVAPDGQIVWGVRRQRSEGVSLTGLQDPEVGGDDDDDDE